MFFLTGPENERQGFIQSQLCVCEKSRDGENRSKNIEHTIQATIINKETFKSLYTDTHTPPLFQK